MYTHSHTHAHIHTYTHMHMHTHAHTHAYIHTCTHTHAHAHTHMYGHENLSNIPVCLFALLCKKKIYIIYQVFNAPMICCIHFQKKICDPFWENLPIHVRADTFFLDLLIKLSVTAYLLCGASFDATLTVVLTI